jgi:integrase
MEVAGMEVEHDEQEIIQRVAALDIGKAEVVCCLWCGLPGITSHIFRKTTATLLDNAGLSARTIADQLGHAQPSVTQNV